MRNIKRTPYEIDLLLIDYDDVLVDIDSPGITTLKKTLLRYLSVFLGIKFEEEEILTDEEIHLLRDKGGFFNYEELTFSFIQYFLSLLEKEYDEGEYFDFSGIDILNEFKKRNGKNIENGSLLLKRKNIEKFAEDVKKMGGGLKGVEGVTRGKNKWLSFSEGYITMDNFALRLFKEIYLGEALFREKYHQQRCFIKEEGQILNEKITLSKEILNKLRRHYPLAIVSSRTYGEVNYVLERNEVKEFFDCLVASSPFSTPEDEYILGSDYKSVGERTYFSKLMEAIERLKAKEEFKDFIRVGYFGGLISEEKSIKRLSELFQTIYIVFYKYGDISKLTETQKREADFIIDAPEKILEVLGLR